MNERTNVSLENEFFKSGKQHLSNALSHNDCSLLIDYFEDSGRHQGNKDGVIPLQGNDIIQSSALEALKSAYQSIIETFKSGWKIKIQALFSGERIFIKLTHRQYLFLTNGTTT